MYPMITYIKFRMYESTRNKIKQIAAFNNLTMIEWVKQIVDSEYEKLALPSELKIKE